MQKLLQNPYFQLHIAVFLFGFTAILGKLISVQEIYLVIYRIILTVISFALIPKTYRNIKLADKTSIIKYALTGIIIASHWLFFYASIKYSNASIGVSLISTMTLFTAFLDPLINKYAFNPYNIVVGLIILFGLWLIYSFNLNYTFAIILGLISSFLSSLFTCINKRLISHGDVFAITFIELLSGLVFLLLALPIYQYFIPSKHFIPNFNDIIYLILLSVFCTTIAFMLSLNALKHISAFTVNLSINLEPVYGIILAIIFLKENKELNWQFYLGSTIIVLSIFLYSYFSRKRSKLKVN